MFGMAQRPPIYAYLLCKAQHLDRNGNRHSTFIYIPKLYFLMVMTCYLILKFGVSN